MGPSVTVVKLDPNELDWSGPATVSLLCVVSCTLDFILKELISFSYGSFHQSCHLHLETGPREWGKDRQAVESMGTGVGQQDTCGNFWPFLEFEGWRGMEGRNWPPSRSQIMKDLILSAKKWELSLNTSRELRKDCKHVADRIS